MAREKIYYRDVIRPPKSDAELQLRVKDLSDDELERLYRQERARRKRMYQDAMGDGWDKGRGPTSQFGDFPKIIIRYQHLAFDLYESLIDAMQDVPFGSDRSRESIRARAEEIASRVVKRLENGPTYFCTWQAFRDTGANLTNLVDCIAIALGDWNRRTPETRARDVLVGPRGDAGFLARLKVIRENGPPTPIELGHRQLRDVIKKYTDR